MSVLCIWGLCSALRNSTWRDFKIWGGQKNPIQVVAFSSEKSPHFDIHRGGKAKIFNLFVQLSAIIDHKHFEISDCL